MKRSSENCRWALTIPRLASVRLQEISNSMCRFRQRNKYLHAQIPETFDVQHKCTDLSAIAPIRPERSATFYVTIRKIQYGLWEAGCLHNTADLHRAFAFDEFADGVEQRGREL